MRPESQWALLLGTDLASKDPKEQGRALTMGTLASWLRKMAAVTKAPPDRDRLPPVPRRDPSWLAARVDGRALLSARLSALANQGIHVTTVFEPDYPQRLHDVLGPDAPPVLFYAGNLALARSARIAGFVGSREASPASLEATRALARSCAEAGVVVCSGGARGIDREAEEAALEAGGAMLLCPAEGLMHVIRQRRFRVPILEGRMLCLSALDPEAPWMVGHAMERNGIIYASSTLACIMHANDESGGTWAGAVAALERGSTAIASWMGSGHGPANRLLVERGAMAIHSTGFPALLAELRRQQTTKPSPSTPRTARQANLLDAWG